MWSSSLFLLMWMSVQGVEAWVTYTLNGAPIFDRFSSRLVGGPWSSAPQTPHDGDATSGGLAAFPEAVQEQQNLEDSSTTSPLLVESLSQKNLLPPPTSSLQTPRQGDHDDDDRLMVEEVMRSCGGAVQGIRDAQLFEWELERPYLNRANDGFVYWDDGSYTWGPRDLSSAGSSSWRASLCLDPEQRLVVASSSSSSSSNNNDQEGSSSGLLILAKDPSKNRNIEVCWGGDAALLEALQGEAQQINWCYHIRCRMPSPTNNQWIFQRLSWEQWPARTYSESPPDDTNCDKEEEENVELSSQIEEVVPDMRKIQVWMSRPDKSTGRQVRRSMLEPGVLMSETSEVWSAGFIDGCRVRGIWREYSVEGDRRLLSVVLSEGLLMHKTEE